MNTSTAYIVTRDGSSVIASVETSLCSGGTVFFSWSLDEKGCLAKLNVGKISRAKKYARKAVNADIGVEINNDRDFLITESPDKEFDWSVGPGDALIFGEF
jgi:hypothetical protein